MKVLIGLREVAGYYRNLKKGFDECGVECAFLCMAHDSCEYPIEGNPVWIERINDFFKKISPFFYGAWPLRMLWIGFFQNLFGFFLFFFVFWRYDVFIFGSVSTFFFFLELPILKLFGKKVIHVFNGSDARPVFINGFVIQGLDKSTIRSGIRLARVQKMILWMIERWSDAIVNMPSQSHFHKRPVVNAMILGYPMQHKTSASPTTSDHRPEKTVRIVHAPSKPLPKGTFEFRKMIESLRRKGHSIEWIEIIGRPNHEVVEELQRCDFVVDQLYSDIPMAIFPAEAAFFGKPSVVGGYYAKQLRQTLTEEDIPPTLYVRPEKAEEAIESLIIDVSLRKELGLKAETFVKKAWAPKEVALRFLKVIDGSRPERWLFDPYAIRYLEGCGHTAEKGRQVLAAFLEMGGERSLCLNDKPQLKKEFMDWAGTT